MKTDPLNIGQDIVNITFFVLHAFSTDNIIEAILTYRAPFTIGKRHYLSPKNRSSLYNGHSIDSIIRSF